MEKREQDELTEKFMKELTKALENYNNKNEDKYNQLIEEIKLTDEEELIFHKEKMDFMQDFFSKELQNTDKGEIFIVTNKYENDYEYHRYKVAQYKNDKEYKYITFEKDLPENVKLHDIVRKVNGKYIYDEEATQYVQNAICKIKLNIINKRK